MISFRTLFAIFLVFASLFPFVRSLLLRKLGHKYEKLINFSLGILLVLYSGFVAAEYFVLRHETLAVGVFKSRNIKAWDLEANYIAATHPEGPYARDGLLKRRPGLSTPPVFASLYYVIKIVGDDFEAIERIHRVFWWLCNLLVTGILMQYYFRHRRHIVSRDSANAAILTSIFIAGFLLSSYGDYLAGNTGFVVATLITMQIALNDWDSYVSKFLQGFLIAVAFYIKPNILLVVLLISVFSIKRRDYAYIIGVASGILIVFFLSLLAPNINVEVYRDFLFETSKSIQAAMQSNWTNLSIERIGIYQSHGRLISRSLLFLAAFLIILGAGKDERLTWQEIPCLIASVIPWPIFWGSYLAWVFVGVLLWFFKKMRERQSIYIETILIFLLSWFGVINPNPLIANFILLALLLLFFKPQIISWFKKKYLRSPQVKA